MRKQSKTKWLGLLAMAVAGTMIAGSASAIGTNTIETLRYQLKRDHVAGFGYSVLHDSNDDTPMSGYHVGWLSGDLIFDYDAAADHYSLIRSTVLSDGGIDFNIVGGELYGDGGGWFDYTLSGAPQFAAAARIIFQGGAAICCGPTGPNYIDDQDLRLWGASDVGEGNGRIGVDLGAISVPLPEPSSALLFMVGGLVLRRHATRRA